VNLGQSIGKNLLIVMATLLVLFGPALSEAGTAAPVADPVLLGLAAEQDWLGARVRVKELAASLVSSQADSSRWKWLERQVVEHPEWGEDLLSVWLQKAADANEKEWFEASSVQTELDAADQDLISKKFDLAIQKYRRVLQNGSPEELIGPTPHFIRLGLARALYGAKKYEEAQAELRKIPPQFSRYRHVLFLKMWNAFRAGRAESALGEVAAQRSAYFGQYMEPESYLLAIYLLKRLCREQESNAILAQVEDFLSDLKSGKFTYREWASMEVGTRTYLEIAKKVDPARLNSPAARAKLHSREKERKWIVNLLQSSFEKKKRQWIEELPRVLAYSRLAITPGLAGGLKPIERISNREKLLAQGFEIWPVEDGEQWLDEMGYQRYIGDTQCGKK